MGLDQYLHHAVPNPLDPDYDGVELAYWRKDWELQNFIGSDNCEDVEIDEFTCDDILANLDSLYPEDSQLSYRYTTEQAFTEAKAIIAKGGKVIYNGNW